MSLVICECVVNEYTAREEDDTDDGRADEETCPFQSRFAAIEDFLAC